MRLTSMRVESVESHADAVRRAIDDARTALGQIHEAWVLELSVEARPDRPTFHVHVLFGSPDDDATSSDPEAESGSAEATDPPTEDVQRANDDVHDPAR